MIAFAHNRLKFIQQFKFDEYEINDEIVKKTRQIFIKNDSFLNFKRKIKRNSIIRNVFFYSNFVCVEREIVKNDMHHENVYSIEHIEIDSLTLFFLNE